MCTLDELNAEHKFQVWVTKLGRMSRHFIKNVSVVRECKLNVRGFRCHSTRHSFILAVQKMFVTLLDIAKRYVIIIFFYHHYKDNWFVVQIVLPLLLVAILLLIYTSSCTFTKTAYFHIRK